MKVYLYLILVFTDFTLGAADQFSLISHDIDKSHVNETALSNASVFTGRNTQSQNQITEGKYLA